MLKILNIIGTSFDSTRGGVVSFLKSYLGYFVEDDEIQYDIVCLSENRDGDSVKKLQKNANLYILPEFKLKKIKEIRTQFSHLLDEQEYDVVHLHSANMGFVFLPIAKRKRVKKIVVHSHNTKLSESKMKCFRNRVLCMHNEKFLTHRCACSTEAGISMFGKEKFTVIPNAIHSSKFAYNEEKRDEIRKFYGIDSGDFLIGTIGRLCRQKNQKFLIHVMNECLKENPNIKLMIVGDGELKDDLMSLAEEMNLKKNVLLVGHQSNVHEFLSAFDLFVLPYHSLHLEL